MIVIVSDTSDAQVSTVSAELRALGADHGLLNVADYPTNARSSFDFGDGESHCDITLHDGRTVSAREVSAVWFRKPNLLRLHSKVTAQERQFTWKECQAGLQGVYDALSGAYWISPLANIRAASSKLRQLRVATRLRFEVPRGVFTNDADVARSFVASMRGRPVVYKSIGDAALVQSDGPWDVGHVVGEIFTTLVDDHTIDQGLARLDACPVLLQEYVPKEVELRITVVADAVFAVELRSQAQVAARVDWRQGSPLELEHLVATLPEGVEAQCRVLVHALGLQFGAIDMIRTPDGRYVFLEINPNGQYGWLEEMLELPISREIARRLAPGVRIDSARSPRSPGSAHVCSR